MRVRLLGETKFLVYEQDSKKYRAGWLVKKIGPVGWQNENNII